MGPPIGINSPSAGHRVADFRYLNTISSSNDRSSKRKNSEVFCLSIGLLLCFMFLVINFVKFDIFSVSTDWSKSSVNSDCTGNWPSPKCKDGLPRSEQYCANTIYGGNEGTFPNDEKWILKQLILVIRHGDRSSIHHLPNTPHSKRSESSPRYIKSEALKYIPRLHSFQIKKISEGSINENCLNETDIFQASSEFYPEASGQLTTSGFMQHISQGMWLRNAYFDLVGRIASTSSIYVRSTNYDRTIQSAAALLSGMVPGLLKPTGAGKNVVTIQVHPSDSAEAMHGVGIRLTSATVGSGDVEVEGSCKAAVAFGASQAKAYVPPESVYGGLEKLFGSEVKKKKMTELADAVLPYRCHDMALPCKSLAPDGSRPAGQCVTDAMLDEMVVEGDRVYCERYNGKHGGHNGTALSMYPFLKEISDSFDSSRYAVKLFSGHDTVVAATLASLGVMNDASFGSRYCRWPSYASRVAFELWVPRGADSVDSGVAGHGGAGIRMIYNGEDVTRLIPACGVPHHSLRSTLQEASSPCPLPLFRSQIESILGGKPSHEEACKGVSG